MYCTGCARREPPLKYYPRTTKQPIKIVICTSYCANCNKFDVELSGSIESLGPETFYRKLVLAGRNIKRERVQDVIYRLILTISIGLYGSAPAAIYGQPDRPSGNTCYWFVHATQTLLHLIVINNNNAVASKICRIVKPRLKPRFNLHSNVSMFDNVRMPLLCHFAVVRAANYSYKFWNWSLIFFKRVCEQALNLKHRWPERKGLKYIHIIRYPVIEDYEVFPNIRSGGRLIQFYNHCLLLVNAEELNLYKNIWGFF